MSKLTTEEIIRINIITETIKVNKNKEISTYFDSKTVPQISLNNYARRILGFFKQIDEKYNEGAKDVVSYLIIAIEYIKRVDVQVTEYSVHRLLLVACMLAFKMISEDEVGMKFFSNVGGVSVLELTEMELEFLWRIGFDLLVGEYEYEKLTEKCSNIYNVPSIVPRRKVKA